MRVKGFIVYDMLEETRVDFDLQIDKSLAKQDKNVVDAVSFALFDKTIFNDNFIKKMVPCVVLEICDEKEDIYIARQPEYIRTTSMGKECLRKGIFSIKIGELEYDGLSSDKYYELLNQYLHISYEEFKSLCK